MLPYTQRYITEKNLALGVTVAGIFFITLLVVSVITMRISDFVLDSRAGPLDRTLGFVSARARGLGPSRHRLPVPQFLRSPRRSSRLDRTPRHVLRLKGLGDDLYSHLPDDPEGTIMAKLRGQKGGQATQPAATTATAPDNSSDEDAETPPDDADAPAQSQPGYATDDKNQLERQIETPPGD